MKPDWAKSIEELIKNSPKPSMRKIEEGFVRNDNERKESM